MKYDAIILTDTKVINRVKPLGAYVIANSLRKAGYNCLVIDHFSAMKKEKLFHFLEKFIGENTVFVGYSSTFLLSFNDGKYQFLGVEIEQFTEINEHIKKLNKKTKIVFGGAYSKKLSQFCLENKNNLVVDYVMHGYSEGMIVDFMKREKEGKSQKFSKKNYGLYEIDYDFKGDSLKFCDEKFHWHDDDLIFEDEPLPIELSRGCIFKCKFCAYPLLGKNKNDYTYLKTEENILSEVLSNYERFKTLNYQIIDDTFNERTEKLETLLRVRDKAKLNLTFVGYNRLDLIHRFPEQISLFKDLNFRSHFFGIETFNYESSKIIGKGLKEVDATETLLKIKNSFEDGKVNIAAGFIVGLPKETPKTFFDWFSRVSKDDYPVDTLVLSALHLSETTHTTSEFFSNPSKYGYEFVEDVKVSSVYSYRNWKNEHWSLDDCTKIAQDMKKILYSNGRNKVSGFYSIALAYFQKDFVSTLDLIEKDINYTFYREKFSERIEKYFDRLENL
jgi:radical SAM superfamily enzyme YgiQ (UPF0313 family)